MIANINKIALITVLYNCEKHLSLFFQCLGQQTDQGYIVIVIDNSSKDYSLECARNMAKACSVPCDFITNDNNLGIAVGNNQGIERAIALGMKHLVLINNDVSFEPTLIANIRMHAIDKGYFAWTCLAYSGDTRERWYGGGRLSYWLARGIHYDKRVSERISQPVTVSYAPTCLMYLHASVFERVGLMDEQYFVYYDDTDYCRRLNDAGISIIYDPTISFKHYVGGSSGGDLSPFFLRISTRNKFIFIRKHYDAPMRWVVGLIALSSKLLQLTDGRRRRPTWQGLIEVFTFFHKVHSVK